MSDEQWEAIAPLIPTGQPGARRKDDRRILTGIPHVIKSDCRWKDCLSNDGPPTTAYNRFNRWSRRGFRVRMPKVLAKAEWSAEAAALDSIYVGAQRAAHGGKGGREQAIGPSRAGGGPPGSMSSPM